MKGNKQMAIDLKTIDERLAKAKEEVAFWENARAIFLDPRIVLSEMGLPLRGPFRPSAGIHLDIDVFACDAYEHA